MSMKTRVTDLKSIKVALYSALLKKWHRDLSDSEVDLMFTLSTDADIQEFLSATLNPVDSAEK